jgi:transposase
MRPFGSPEQLQKRRERAVQLLHTGVVPVEVARQLGVDRRSVRRWNAAYRVRGAQGILAVTGRVKFPTLWAGQTPYFVDGC